MNRQRRYLNPRERLLSRNAKRVKNENRIGRNYESKQVEGATLRAAVSSRPVKEETDEVTVRLQKLHLLILKN